MPITEFQRSILLLLKKNRNPNSYIAGGIAIHRTPVSTRQSNDIDFFHDTDEAVRVAAEADVSTLRDHGFEVEILLQQPSFVRVTVIKGDSSLKLEWVRDTSFRFFPVLEDPDLGYRLHDADLAINKCLALANRSEVRDIIDLVQMNSQVLSLAATCWAACGKDPGFTPELLLDQMRRNSVIRPEQLMAESLSKPISPPDLKKQWISILNPVSALLEKFPAEDLGCLYLNPDNSVVVDPKPENLQNKKRHFGSVGGSWPRIVRA